MQHINHFLNILTSVSVFTEDSPIDPTGATDFLRTLFSGIITFISFCCSAALGFGIIKIGFKIHAAAVADDSEAQKRGWINLGICILGFCLCMVAFGLAAAITAGVPMLGFTPEG